MSTRPSTSPLSGDRSFSVQRFGVFWTLYYGSGALKLNKPWAKQNFYTLPGAGPWIIAPGTVFLFQIIACVKNIFKTIFVSCFCLLLHYSADDLTVLVLFFSLWQFCLQKVPLKILLRSIPWIPTCYSFLMWRIEKVPKKSDTWMQEYRRKS